MAHRQLRIVICALFFGLAGSELLANKANFAGTIMWAGLAVTFWFSLPEQPDAEN